MDDPIPRLRITATSAGRVRLTLLGESDHVVQEREFLSLSTPEFESDVREMLTEWSRVSPAVIWQLAHDWALARGAHLLSTPVSDLRTVIVYIGDDVSVCAVDKGDTVWRSTLSGREIDSAELDIRQLIASAAVCLDRLDALILTVADQSDHTDLRNSVIDGLDVLGIRGPLATDREQVDAIITDPGRSVPVILVTSREEQQVESLVRDNLASRSRTAQTSPAPNPFAT